MGKLIFVPLSDEMIYERPELITGPIGAFAPQKVEFPVSGQVRERGVDWRKNKDQGGDIQRKIVGAKC